MITCGVDPSRGSLAISLVEDRKEIDYFEVKNDGQGHAQFLKNLKQHMPMPGVYIEGHGDFAKRFALFCDSNNVQLYEINPLKARRLKESITVEKSDHIDARVAALMPFNNEDMHKMRISLRAEGLKKMAREYESISNDSTSYKNRLHAHLNQNYGQMYKKFFKKFSNCALHFFIEYSDPGKLYSATVAEIHEVLKRSGSRYYIGRNGLKKAMDIKSIISKECPESYDYYTEATSGIISATAGIIMQLELQKNRLSSEMAAYTEKYYPGFLKVFKEKFSSIGAIQLAQLLGELGPISKYENDGHLAAYAGQASRTMQSANQTKNVRRKGYNRSLARVVHCIALNNTRKNCIFHEYYEEKKKRFAKKLRALKSVKRVVCKIIFEALTEIEEVTKRSEYAA